VTEVTDSLFRRAVSKEAVLRMVVGPYFLRAPPSHPMYLSAFCSCRVRRHFFGASRRFIAARASDPDKFNQPSAGRFHQKLESFCRNGTLNWLLI
jgi:hypothetical protein